MKKKHLTYAKKTLSVFLTVLMLMSAWVWVAPEKASAASAVEYPLSVTVYNTTKLNNGGNIKVYYYEVNSDGTLGSTEIEHILVSSLTRDKDANPTYTDTIPGFPVRIAVTVANYGWGTDKTSVRVIKIGEKTIFNDAYTVQDNQTIEWKMGTTLGSWSPVGVWENPSWTASSTMSGTSVQVPAYGSRTVSWSTKASWKDQYGVTWPQSNVSYTIPATNGVTISQSNGALTGVTATSAAISNITSGSTKDVTVTAALGTSTSIKSTANITLNAPTKDVLYENLFSLSDWYYSDSSKWSDSNVVTDVNAGTVKITNPSSDSSTEYVTNATTGTHPSNYYSIPVKGGSSYYFTWKTANATSTEVFFMWKDSNGAGISYPSAYFSGNGTHWAEFTAPSNAESVELRFDNNTDGTTVTFSDIAVYEKTRADEIGIKNWTTRPVKKTYTYNASSAASAGLDQPVRTGYTFSGWQNSDGSAYTAQTMNQNRTVYSSWSINNYTANFEGNGGTPVKPSLDYTIADSITLPNATRDDYVFGSWKVTTAAGNWTDGATYAANATLTGMYGNPTLTAQWTKLHTVSFLNADGTVFTTVKVEDGKDATLPATNPTKASDDTASYNFAGWEGNLTNVTEDRTVTPTFTATEHTFVWAANPYKAATCTDPALVEKYCKNCPHSLGNVPYDGDNVNWLARGHNFTGEVVQNSSTGIDGKHQVKCVDCDATAEADHVWVQRETEGATCSTHGTVHWECACLEKKTTEGDLAPDVHVNTEIKDKQDATCTKDGYTGDTYCNDCKEVVVAGTVEPMLGHSFKNYVSDGNATCTEDGTKTAKCERCDVTDTKKDEGSAKGHSWKDEGEDLYQAADCENDAVYWQTCGTCGISAKDDTTDTGSTWIKANTKKGHDYTGTVRDNKDGTHSYLCANGCGTYGYEGVKEASTGCTYGEWSKTEAATHTKTCTECKYSVTEDHDWTAWTSTDENKDSAGQHTRSCNVCGRVETVDCSYEDVATKETCTVDGYTTHTCTVCGHDYVTAGAAKTGHDYTGTVQSFNNGYHNYLCQNGCGTYGFEEIKDNTTTCTYEYKNNIAGEHQVTCTECKYTFAQGCSGGQATCTAAAVCEKCNTAYGTTAPHSFKGEAVKLEGDFHAYLCEFCGETTGIKGVGDSVDGKEACSGGTATCSALAVCDKCGDGHGELDADAHKWGAWTNIDGTETHERFCEYNSAHREESTCESSGQAIVDADCETAGYTLKTCDFCNHQWQTNPVDPLGHKWSNWVSNDAGSHTRVCERAGCHYAADHTAKTETALCTKDNAEAAVTDPTCLDEGYTTYTCKDCGYEWVDDYTDATGHSYLKQTKKTDAIYKRTDKNCTTDLTYWYRCDNCDVSAGTEADNYTDITVLYWVSEAAAGHKFDDKKATEDYLATPATCTAKATYYYSCSVCGTSSKDTDGEKTFEYGAVLGHDWQNTEEYKKSDADCINNEVYYKECSRCHISSENVTDETWEKAGTLAGHDFDHDDDGVIGNEGDAGYTAGVAAECLKDGMTEHYTCQTCGKHYTDADATKEIAADKLVIAGLKHDYKDVNKKDATCEEDGYTAHKQCQRCDYRNSDYKVIPAEGHDFKAENGYFCDAIYNYHAYKCTNCECYGVDNVKYSVDASGLDPEIVGGIACTFTGEYVNYEDANGVHSHKLTCVCGNVQSDVCEDTTPEHVAPTCEEAGYYVHTCETCGFVWNVASEAEEDEAKGHSYDDEWTKVEGKDEHIRYCKNECGKSETEDCSTENPVNGCGEQNVCDTCGGKFGKYTEHVWVKVEDEAYVVSAATCTDGTVYYYSCENCDTSSKDTEFEKTFEADDSLGHDMTTEYKYDVEGWQYAPEGIEDLIKEPTCKEEGKAISYCSRCSVYKLKSVPKDASKHEFSDEWEFVSGNCATGVTYKVTCKHCGKVKTKTEPAEHTFVIVHEELPTCEGEGYRKLKCSICQFIEEEYYNQATEEPADLAPLGHNVEEWTEGDATCKELKYKYGTCTRCEKTVVEESEVKGEHTYKTVAAKKATCDIPGHNEYQLCEVCGIEEGKIVITVPHKDGDENGKCDECNRKLYTDGDTEKSCGCICHKENWLMKIIYKILNFFWKLFKISKSCECGAVHW